MTPEVPLKGLMDPLSVEEAVPELVWESERLSQLPFRVLRGHRSSVTSCHFCCKDTKILTSSHDRTAKLWDASTCSAIGEYGGEHVAPITECNPTQDSTRMVTSSYDKTVKLWDLETGKVLWSVSLDGLVTSCHISVDGKLVVCSADVDNAVCIIDTEAASKVITIKGHHTSTITRCCFDAESQRVCSVSSDRSVKLWDVIAQRTTINLKGAHDNAVSSCSFSASGRLLCTSSWDRSLKLWDINTGGYRLHGPDHLLHAHRGSVSCCTFSKDGSTLVSGGYDKTVVLWDVVSSCKKLVLKGHADWVLDVALSTNRKQVLSSSKDATVRLWNIEDCEQIPAVIENKKAMGSRIAQCEECQRSFPIMHWDNTNVINKCVFCRLPTPSVLHLPAIPLATSASL
ncbi:WD repeat-containing protein 88 [Hyperolius riggenbachi]|uniref:WD repeat-containing protein 88 n=1 Tax=Hyperolius riggenbachi TaxID=752182 RepID=UPI0035A31EC2